MIIKNRVNDLDEWSLFSSVDVQIDRYNPEIFVPTVYLQQLQPKSKHPTNYLTTTSLLMYHQYMNMIDNIPTPVSQKATSTGELVNANICGKCGFNFVGASVICQCNKR